MYILVQEMLENKPKLKYINERNVSERKKES